MEGGSSGSSEEKKEHPGDYLQKTPCVRSSLIMGIASGLGVGIAAFMFTKHVKKSCDFAVGSFAVISTGSWGYCSYNRRQQQKNIDMVIKTLEIKNKENKEKIDKFLEERRMDKENNANDDVKNED